MRTAAPWLSSLVLHSLFLLGIVIISRTPPELPKQLILDFQLVPPVIEEVVAPAPPVVAPPPPVAKIKEVEPVEMIKPAEPEEIAVEEAPPPPEPPEVVPQPEVTETPMLSQAPAVDIFAEQEAAEAARYVQTVSHVRGQVLNKLRYPPMARRMGWYGKMVLGFILCDDGSVEDLEVLVSSGYKVLDRAALQAVAANTPFRGGYPRTQVKLPINFQLD